MRARLLFGSLLLGCRMLPAPTPMAYVQEGARGGAPARCLMVLLPGGGDQLGKFAEEGFVGAIAASGASVDVVSADATMGYYFRGVVDERLEQDVLAPLRAGHEHVWLLGVSMGGFGALHHAQQHAAEIDGVIVLAAYLGDRRIFKEIEAAGGLAGWQPDPPVTPTRKNFQRQLWSWLHRTTAAGAQAPTLLLGYGDDDRLAAANRLLGAALPEDQVVHRPGGHDWPVWRELLAALLKHPRFVESCRATPGG